jgi:hypothetical protein
MRTMMQAGWLQDLTNWIGRQLTALFEAIVEFFGDLLVLLVESVLNLFAMAVEAIPVPDWVTTNSIGAFLNNGGDTLMWAVGTFKIGEGLALIGLGFGFRLLRKLLTLGQW